MLVRFYGQLPPQQPHCDFLNSLDPYPALSFDDLQAIYTFFLAAKLWNIVESDAQLRESDLAMFLAWFIGNFCGDDELERSGGAER